MRTRKFAFEIYWPLAVSLEPRAGKRGHAPPLTVFAGIEVKTFSFISSWITDLPPGFLNLPTVLKSVCHPVKNPIQIYINHEKKIVRNSFFFFLFSYSRVHKSSDSFFSKILEKPSIVQKKMIPHITGLVFSLKWCKKKFKMAALENSKWPPQKNLIFQLRQFSIFFHEIFMDWSLG